MPTLAAVALWLGVLSVILRVLFAERVTGGSGKFAPDATHAPAVAARWFNDRLVAAGAALSLVLLFTAVALFIASRPWTWWEAEPCGDDVTTPHESPIGPTAPNC